MKVQVVIKTKILLKIPLDAADLLQSDRLPARLQKYGVGVVIPCYNEAKRLKTDAFVRENPSYHIYFVNNGSTENTLELLNEFAVGKESLISVYNCEKNSEKAEAVRLSMLHLARNESYD
jgi:cellulose synthase/poly-beta-1,6-N-acetylglucosamine synthase-like glycosyltransferase